MSMIRFHVAVDVLPRFRLAAKALLKAPTEIGLSVSQFFRYWGPERIKSFVSIGANDGRKNDPVAEFIRRYGWTGIMVEPLVANFQRLQDNYADIPNISFEQVGISDTAGDSVFYCLGDIRSEEPDWYDQVGSFHRETFLNNIAVEPSLLHREVREVIRTVTFDMLMQQYRMTSVDLLMIDAEGYDGRILSSIDLDRYHPLVVVFEQEWLTSYEMKKLRSMLASSGYRRFDCGVDCIAVRMR
jgi:FkbM family methyltransferase